MRSRLSAQPYDLVVDTQGLLKSALLARLAHGPRAGFDRASVRETLADPKSMAYGQQLAFYDPLSASAAAFLGIHTATAARTDEIAAGRAYARANLVAASLGLAMQPLSQALQEFPEMNALRAEMDRLTNAPPAGRLQMLARVGYAKDVPPSPRRPYTDNIRA
jgi:hypothetical protein